MAKLPGVRGASILKRNRTDTLRTIRKYKGKYVQANVVGNHIRSDAKVGNMDKYMEYASTDLTPYFVSTRSRYDAFMQGHNSKIDTVLGSYKSPHHSPFVQLAEGIEKNEAKEIMKVFKPIWPELGSANEIVKKMNGLQTEVDGALVKIEDIVRDAAQAVQKAFWTYRIADETARHEAEAHYGTILKDPYNFSTHRTGSIVEGLEPSIGYRGDLNKIRDDLISAVEMFVSIFDFVELEEGGKANTFSKPISAMVVPLATSNWQINKGKGVSDKKFASLMEKINEITSKVDVKLGGELDKVGINRAFFNSGQFAEVLIAGLTAKAIEESKQKTQIDSSEIKNELENNAGKVAVSLVSDNPDDFNTIDLKMTVGMNSLGIDVKTHNQSKTEKFGGLVYESTMIIDFKAAQKSLFSNKQRSLPASVLKMYRAYLLNKSVNEGYTLATNKERGMYVMEYLKSNEGFDHKFKSGKMGYPILVSINGKYFRFSEVISKLNSFDDFFADFKKQKKGVSKDSALLAGPSSLSSYGMNPEDLYMAKIAAGSKGQEGQKTKIAKTMPGFSNKVPGLNEMVKRIENDYFNIDSKKTVDFKIILKT